MPPNPPTQGREAVCPQCNGAGHILVGKEPPIVELKCSRCDGTGKARDEGRESDCGHQQPSPTSAEIAGCPEVIVRRCAECDAELWWNVDQWRRL